MGVKPFDKRFDAVVSGMTWDEVVALRDSLLSCAPSAPDFLYGEVIRDLMTDVSTPRPRITREMEAAPYLRSTLQFAKRFIEGTYDPARSSWGDILLGRIRRAEMMCLDDADLAKED